MLGHFCGLDSVPVFCVETQLGNGPVFVLIHHGHGAELSDVDVLRDCLCATGEQHALAVRAGTALEQQQGPANSARPVAGCRGLLFSLFFRKSCVFTVSAGPVVAWSPAVPEFPYILSSLISELGNRLSVRGFCEK